MISFPFVLVTLILACAAVSVVYALCSPGDQNRVIKETVTSFGLMFGGIVALAVAILVIPKIFGR